MAIIVIDMIADRRCEITE